MDRVKVRVKVSVDGVKFRLIALESIVE